MPLTVELKLSMSKVAVVEGISSGARFLETKFLFFLTSVGFVGVETLKEENSGCCHYYQNLLFRLIVAVLC